MDLRKKPNNILKNKVLIKYSCFSIYVEVYKNKYNLDLRKNSTVYRIMINQKDVLENKI